MQPVPMTRAEWGTFTMTSLMRGECANLTSLTLSCAASSRAPLRPAARRLPPRLLASAQMPFAADVTPRRSCSTEPLQRRAEAGPRRLQRGVRRHSRLSLYLDNVKLCPWVPMFNAYRADTKSYSRTHTGVTNVPSTSVTSTRVHLFG
jgi:hypothetical protein